LDNDDQHTIEARKTVSILANYDGMDMVIINAKESGLEKIKRQ
jgi:hypothetical protein